MREGTSWWEGTRGALRLEREWMNERMREKWGGKQKTNKQTNKKPHRAQQLRESHPAGSSHPQKTLDEMTLLWPTSQKPGLPQELIFIFLLRVHWWFHKNS